MPNSATDTDRERIEAIYLRLGRAVLARLYSVCCDRDLALEATQEAFLRLQDNLASVREPMAWLVQTGRNWLHDAARRRRRMGAGSEVQFDELPGGDFCPEQSALTAELRKLVADGLQELDAGDREILVLRYSMDLPSAQIAEMLNISASAVDMRLSRARSRMATLLESVGVSHEVV